MKTAPISRRSAISMLAAAGASMCAGSALSQEPWPQKPVRIIVPFAPGGSSDVITRRFAQVLSARLGQSFYVENRAGGMGTIGMAEAARAQPDGYTLVSNDTGIVMLPHLMKNVPYDADRDFVPIGASVFSPFGLVVNAGSPVNSLQQLIAKAKAAPGTVSFGSGGVGTSPHLAAEALADAAGVKLLHVPFKGAGEAIVAVASNTIDMQLVTPATAMGNLKGGKLKMLAISGEQRLSALPETQTFAEAGLRGFGVWNWIGLWAPKGTPAPIVERLRAEMVAAMQTSDMKAFAASLSAEPKVVVGDEFVRTLRETDQMWKRVIDKAGLKPQ